MKNEALERPVITEFMGDGFKLDKAHEMYLNNLELWNYVQALDEYCDYLESKSCEGKPDSDTSGGLHLACVNAMLPDLDIDKAEELAMKTDYACFAVEEDGNDINTADAGTFFLEGYNYAKGNLR